MFFKNMVKIQKNERCRNMKKLIGIAGLIIISMALGLSLTERIGDIGTLIIK